MNQSENTHLIAIVAELFRERAHVANSLLLAVTPCRLGKIVLLNADDVLSLDDGGTLQSLRAVAQHRGENRRLLDELGYPNDHVHERRPRVRARSEPLLHTLVVLRDCLEERRDTLLIPRTLHHE